LCCLCQIAAHGQGTAFAYEGQFDVAGSPVTGVYDFQFTLYDAGTNGDLIAGPVTLPAVTVNNGVYLVSLNFGSALNGAPLWLESDERATGSQGAYTPIVPRQELTPVPYAVFAETASNLSGTISSGGLAGTYTNSVTFYSASGTFNGSFSGTISGNGNGLTSLNAANLTGTVPGNSLSGPYGSAITFSNALDIFAGKMIGDGSGLSNLTYAHLTGPLPSTVITNFQTTADLDGTFYGYLGGNGSAITSLNATNLTGNVPSKSLAGTYTNTVTISNTLNIFVGKMIGDGSSLTNLPVGGVLPAAIVTNNETGVTLSGAFSGNGVGLTSLNATNLTGSAPSGALAGTYSNALIVSNASDIFAGKMIGDGSGLTNLPIGGVLPSGIITNNEAGVTLGGSFSGNGNLLTSLNATNLIGTVPSNGLAGSYTNNLTFSNALNIFAGKMVGDGSGLTNLPIGGVLPTAIVTNNEIGVTLSGAFSGNGSLLTSLSATNLIGAVPSLALAGPYTNSVIISNASDVFAGKIIGDGSGLTNLPINGILPSGFVTNNQTGVVLSGTFSGTVSGNGNGLTSLNAANLVGSMPSGVLGGSYTNNITFSNASGNFTGKVSGDGSGLTNLNYSQISGGVSPGSIVTNNASGVTLGGTFNGILSGNGAGITNLFVANGTPGVVRDTSGATNMIIATNVNGKIFFGAPPQTSNLFSNDSPNGVTFDFGSHMGPEIVVPSGATTMFKFGARELQGTGGSSGVYFTPVQTNVAGFLDVMPSGVYGTNLAGSSIQGSWIDILDRSLARNDPSNYIALHLGMGQFQGSSGEAAYICVNSGGTNMNTPLALGATNIYFRVAPTVGGKGSDMAFLSYNGGTVEQILYDGGGNNAIINFAGNTTTTEVTSYDPRWELNWNGLGIGLAASKSGIMEINNGVAISNYGQYAGLVAANLSAVNTNMANYAVVTNDLVSQHLVGRTNQLPTIVAGPGAGSGATVSIVGSDGGGQVTITTGASPSSSAVVATVTFGKAYPGTTYPVVWPASASASQLGILPYVTGAAAGWTLNTGTTGLSPSTVYSYTYNVVGSQ
jgi:hypothetical protein